MTTARPGAVDEEATRSNICASRMLSSLVMDLRDTHYSAADADALYRTDGIGRRAVIVPATCRSGRHALAVGGYRLTEGSGLLQVRCDTCAAQGDPRHSWFLRTTGLVANYAELDDAPYRTNLG